MKKLMLSLVICIFLISMIGAGFAGDVNLTGELVSYWKFDEGSGSVLDAHGGNAGTNSGAVNTSGKILSGYDFSSDNINFGDNASLEPTEGLTLSAWVYADTLLSDNNAIIDKGDCSNTYNLQYSTGNLRFCVNDQAINTNLSTGQWVHIVGTYDKSNIRLYVNGINKANASYSSSINQNSNPLRIGSKYDGANNYWDGKIDEVGIWNRGLTVGEVQGLYNSGSGEAYPLTITNSTGSITQHAPADTHNFSGVTTTKAIEFNCSAKKTDGVELANLSIYTNETGTWAIRNTTSVSGTTNSTNFTRSLSIGSHLWACYSCDSNGICGFSDTNRTLNYTRAQYIENLITYNAAVISASEQEFKINITYDDDTYNGISVLLNYNNTNYTMTTGDTGSTREYDKTITVPSVIAEEDKTFKFFIQLSNASGLYIYESTSNNQTISPIVINSTCNGDMFVIYNITLRDETTQAILNATGDSTSMKIFLTMYNEDRSLLLNTYNENVNSINPTAICLDTNLSAGEEYSADLQIQYTADGYTTEFYNLDRDSIDNSTLNQSINLYALNSSLAQSFRLVARNRAYLPLTNAVIKIERKYLENGSFYVVEMPKTDGLGYATASLEIDKAIYNFHIYQNGVLQTTYSNVIAICQNPSISTCEIDFAVYSSSITIPNYETYNDFNFTLDYNSTSRIISSEFIVLSGDPSLIELEVIRDDALGTSICSDSVTAASGTLSCVVPNSFGNSTVRANLYKDGELVSHGTIKIDTEPSDIYGGILIFMSVIILMTLIGVGVSDSPVVTLISLFIGIVLIFALNLVANTGFLGATASILFLAIAIIIILIKVSRRTP